MTPAPPHSLAIVGAGPIGLETAFAALDAGFDVHVFERGEVAEHLIAWGHVRMFTPWRMNLGPRTLEHLKRSGWQAPDPDVCPTGLELAERALQPASQLLEIRDRVHAHSQVVHMGRRGGKKGEPADRAARRQLDFRLLVRDAGGRENFLHAHSLVDASGIYGQPNWAGDGGIPARGELYLAPQLSYHVDDVLGLRRERYAGKRALVIGGGLSAATVVRDLAKLANEVEGGSVAWITRRPLEALYAIDAGDPLPEHRVLMEQARALLRGSDARVGHVGGVCVEGIEFNSATHRYRLVLRGADRNLAEEGDQVIVNTGFGPDNAIYRELQVGESHLTRGPAKLAAVLLSAGGSSADCHDVPPIGVETLSNPEPGFFILGNKSYGRINTFLLETGYRQAGDVIAALRSELGAPVPG
ncbi:MAG TPA: hypothetical protein VMJ70_04165 [Candidatus Sulfotelmatobacter sp.]|nr:hypothetical protein [Candidatus Sulfotelmatobacter sp.]